MPSIIIPREQPASWLSYVRGRTDRPLLNITIGAGMAPDCPVAGDLALALWLPFPCGLECQPGGLRSIEVHLTLPYPSQTPRPAACVRCPAGTLLERAAATHPTQEAVVSLHQGARLTYAELLRQADAAARGLLALGVQARAAGKGVRPAAAAARSKATLHRC